MRHVACGLAGLIAALLGLTNAAFGAHDDARSRHCLDCHERLPFNQAPAPLRDEASSICASCHPALGHSHPVGAAPARKPPAHLPLDGRGRVVCTTCHTFHPGPPDSEKSRRLFLRDQPGKAFCHACHARKL